MENVYLGIVLAPLVGAIIAGLFGRQIGRAGAHWVTIIGVAIYFGLSLLVFKHVVLDGAPAFNGSVYTWMVSDGIRFEVGFLIDRLTALMILVVNFVSLMVHIYTIGYMRDDPGYQRFFSYISLFTFSMLMLVMAYNFMQLFLGWEAVGLVSYLLIGFWYKRESAIYANLKAFLVNRVGDFGFLLGIAAVLVYFNSLDYADVFAAAPQLAGVTIRIFAADEWNLMTVICILLFIGAMGKSAQVPLHVWLPASVEGPTPISALIHAATMVTAGIFMVARMSPLYELSETALSFVMIIGAITALFMGFLGIVQNDIKRGHLHGGAHVAAEQKDRDNKKLRDDHRRHHRAVHGLSRHRAERHQARGRVFHAVAAGLYDRGARRLGVCRGHFPPDDPRLLQGAAVPRGGVGDHRPASRAGHPQDGRAPEIHAHHLLVHVERFARADRLSRLLRLLFEGCHHRGGGPFAAARRDLRLCLRAVWCVRDRVVFLPHVLSGVPWQGTHGSPCEGAFACNAAGGDAPAHPPRDPLSGGGLALRRAAGVPGLFRQQHRGAGAARRPRRAG